jgi:hypothetical protein
MTEETEPTTEETLSPEEIEQKLDELRTDNIARLELLQTQGFGMNPLLQLKLRLDTLSAWVVDDSVSSTFELMYETMMAAEIGEVEGEVTRMKLTSGISGGQEPS